MRGGLLDLGLGLQVLEVDPGIAIQDDAGVQDAVRVGELLDPPHHRRRLLAPLARDVRGHVHAGAVLGLQGAVVLADDQLDELLHELVVALEVLGLREVGRQLEVQVAGRRVSGDADQEAVLAEQRLQVARALGDALGTNADVLDDQRAAERAQPPDQPEQALAHAPRALDLVRVARELERVRSAPRPSSSSAAARL